MKKILFISIVIVCILKVSARERDAVFDIRLQHDSLAEDFNVIFKNITNDTILLQNGFKDYITEFRYAPGFRVNFFTKDRQFMPNWGELPKQDYIIDNGKKVGDYNIYVVPEEEVFLTIQLPFGLLIKSDTEKRKKTDSLGIILELYYRYVLIKEKRMEMKYFKSEYFEIKL